jgi:small GTP-binding protein
MEIPNIKRRSRDMKQIRRKICLLGEPSVGKTSLIRRFVLSRFDEKYISTLGTTVSRKTIPIPRQDAEVQLLIWDVSGQREFKRIHSAALKGAKGALVVCDCTRRETLDGLEKWVNSLLSVSGEVPVVFLANKSDLRNEQKIWEEDMENLTSQYDVPYHFTSAKTGDNVECAFKTLGEAMLGPIEMTYPEEVHTEHNGEEVTILGVEDEIVACFCEIMGDTALGMSIVRKQFTDAGIDFRQPTIEGMENIVNRLGAALVPFEGQEKARVARMELMRILNRYKNVRDV